jgi:hypothetical protein
MNIAVIEKHTRVLGAPPEWDQSKGECLGLPVRYVETQQGEALVSAWKPTEEEIEQLRAGATIKLWIFSPAHPVVSLSVGDIE